MMIFLILHRIVYGIHLRQPESIVKRFRGLDNYKNELQRRLENI